MPYDGGNLYRPPAPIPTTPTRALVRGILSNQRDMLGLMPASAYQTRVATVGWTRRKIIMVNEPNLVREILGPRSPDFPKSDLMVDALAPLVRDGVFVSEGTTWERQRRMIGPAFSHMRVDQSFAAMHDAMLAYDDTLHRHAESGAAFSLEEAMSHLTADIVCRTIFSRSLESDAAKKVFHAFATFQESVANVQVLRLWLGRAWQSVRQPQEVEQCAAEIRHQIGRMLDARSSCSNEAFRDIAGDVIAARDPMDGSEFTREELIDQIGVFFLAGHETTAGALAWAFFILSQCPEAVHRIRAEVKDISGDAPLDVEAVKAMRYTRSVFKETLRLYPPLAFIPRIALQAGMLGRHAYPRGALVLISPWLLHRHEGFWNAPDRFDPDRFSSKRESEITPGAYFPFGQGARVCIGANFALIEATLILASIVRKYDISTLNIRDVMPAARLTTRSANGIQVRFSLCP